MSKLGFFLLFAVAHALAAEYPIGFGDECPSKGTLDAVGDTDEWADSCFSRTTGRRSAKDHGESDRLFRDMDLDGTEELLEVRGSGNSSKTIYVLRSTTEGFIYLGALQAHPNFQIDRAADGSIEYIYFHGFGLNEGLLKKIRYVDDEFITVSEKPVSW
ncbi:MAG: hypothetical protein OER22_01715 [Gammaproteobacteria bacterium]|nr:hypothetical protein [Gammaproteobacteria bacterium]MDH3372678.1 hypothetical protein [Gammaproteobacteria bacterium]MDH3408580.1 hypothetical protein [Gammaproteobacteria bacterium]MDH3551310.1 hypothetical protein [Gammaproteobacteria bacterium]